jgi:zinc/manganese transport system substrate-binding protein
MRLRSLLMSLVLVALLAVPQSAWAKIRVVATVPDLAAIAKQIGGDDIDVVSLSLPTQDPHWVDARPNLALALSRADLLLLLGLDMEVGWLPALQTGSRNAKVQTGGIGYLDCSTLVSLLGVPTQKIDRSMGDIHPGGNPHYLVDPRRSIAVAHGIAARMGQLDPAHAALFTTNAQAFEAEIQGKLPGWQARMAPLQGKQLVGYHQSWPYLADWLGFTMLTHVEPRPGVPPTPAHVARTLTTMRQSGVNLIIQEEYHANRATEQVAAKLGATVLKLPGGTRLDEGQTYAGFVDRMVETLAPHVGG